MKFGIWNLEFGKARKRTAEKTDPSAIRQSRFTRAFTLIELMVVVGIIGLILAMGVPTLYHFFHKEGFRKSVGEVMDACRTARERAIMGQQTTTLSFLPDGFRVQSTGGGGWGGDVVSGRLPDDVLIEQLRINGADAMALGLVEIHFFSNGTCDEMELVLLNNRTGERRKISLELTTGLASLEMDPNKWMK